MVFVGYRTTDDGTLMLLVQNWWATKQFLEMDVQYLLAHHGNVTFILDRMVKTWQHDVTVLPLSTSVHLLLPLRADESACENGAGHGTVTGDTTYVERPHDDEAPS